MMPTHHTTFTYNHPLQCRRVARVAQAARAGESAPADMRGGSVTLDVGTNLFAITVPGKSSALDGRARLRESARSLRLEQQSCLWRASRPN